MSSEIAISVLDVGKSYYISNQPQDVLLRQVYTQLGSTRLLPASLRAQLFRRADRHGRRFDALRDISFEVGKAESIGIIGRNGAGKSTLLQIIAGTLSPSQGRVQVRGRVGALLELGAGFNPEFTGRENLLLSGTILGATPEVMKAKLPEIVEFADIGEFLDQPVKTYSSGMIVRLAFAVQISLVPDVLIVDEALSVGDIFFAQKCTARIKELQRSGTTLIFVSHDLGLVRDLCERAIYLRQGRIRYQGPKDAAIALYYQSGAAEHPHLSSSSPRPEDRDAGEDRRRAFCDRACWVNEDTMAIGKRARLVAVTVLDGAARPTLSVPLGDELTLQVLYQSFDERPVHFSVALKNRYDQVVFAGGSYTQQLQPPPLEPGQYGVFQLAITCVIEAGQYTFRISIGHAADAPNRGSKLDETPWLGPLLVTFDYEAATAPFMGMFGLPAVAQFTPLETPSGRLDGR